MIIYLLFFIFSIIYFARVVYKNYQKGLPFEYGQNRTITIIITLCITTGQFLISSIEKRIIIFLIFLFLKQLPLFFLIFIILNSTRPLMGGIHCKTFNSCLIFSISYFIVIMLFSTLSPKLNTCFYIIFFIISFIITLAYAPCRNEKRPIKNKKILK
ncbi:MAG: accessory gene regulator B family protein [Clostridiales bacterium]|nr:accessory gene regulator B family protein [Clostridiales bacterium]